MIHRCGELTRAIGRTSALVSAAAAISACGSEVEVEPLRRAPATESLIQVTRPSSTASEAEAGDNALDEPQAGGNLPHDTETAPEAEQIPEVLYPDGVETRLTAPGTELSFGEEAVVASSDADGQLLLWSITAHHGWPIPPEQVALASSMAGRGAWNFECFAYEMQYLGSVPVPPDASDALPGVVDVDHAPVVPPMVLPVAQSGELSKRVAGGADDTCEVPQESRLPAVQGQLRRDTSYVRAVAAAAKPGSRPEDMPAFMIYIFDYGLPGVADAKDDVAPIIWG